MITTGAIIALIISKQDREISIKEMFKGEELWKTINITIGIGAYAILVASIMIFPRHTWWVILGFFITIPTYIAFYENHLLNIEKAKTETLTK